MIRGYKDLDIDRKKKLVEEHIPLVKYIVDRMMINFPPNIEACDLINTGIIGLMDAVEKFDPERQIQFRTYAELRIKGAILDELRSLDWAPRSMRKDIKRLQEKFVELENELGRVPEDEEMAEGLGLDLDDYYQLLSQSKNVSLLSLEDLGKTKAGEGRDILEVLSDPNVNDPFEELNLSELRDMLGDAIDSLPEKEKMVITLYYYEELNMKEIGEVLDITESRVSQLRTKALLKLKSRVKKFLE